MEYRAAMRAAILYKKSKASLEFSLVWPYVSAGLASQHYTNNPTYLTVRHLWRNPPAVASFLNLATDLDDHD